VVHSWIDFLDGVELFLEKLDRMKELYSRSSLAKEAADALHGLESSGARALLELSRNVFRKSQDGHTLTRLVDLQSLVLSAKNFAVSECRDVIYALLHLANDVKSESNADDRTNGKKFIFTTDYSRPTVQIFSEFVGYCIEKSLSLDIICRTWARWPQNAWKNTLPSWIGVVSSSQQAESSSPDQAVGKRSFVGPPQDPTYAASRGTAMTWKITGNSLHVTGVILGKVQTLSARVNGDTVPEDCLQMLGWNGSLDEGVPDALWRSLVANRTSAGRMVPSWYRRACALALTKLTDYGDLNISKLVANTSQPSTMIEYLKRVQDVVRGRRFFNCQPLEPHSHPTATVGDNVTMVGKSLLKDDIVGIGAGNVQYGDLVCILFGCSVPVILRPLLGNSVRRDWRVKIVGDCYVHDHIESELFVGVADYQAQRKPITLVIH
jgi:hypothetical protein